MNNDWKLYDKYDGRDLVKDILVTILVIAGIFIYWTGLLLLLSLILVHVWRVSFEQLLAVSLILTIITGVLYIIRLVKRRQREMEEFYEARKYDS